MPEDRNLEKTIVETRILLKKPHPSARKQREDVYMHPCEKTSIVHALAWNSVCPSVSAVVLHGNCTCSSADLDAPPVLPQRVDSDFVHP